MPSRPYRRPAAVTKPRASLPQRRANPPKPKGPATKPTTITKLPATKPALSAKLPATKPAPTTRDPSTKMQTSLAQRRANPPKPKPPKLLSVTNFKLKGKLKPTTTTKQTSDTKESPPLPAAKPGMSLAKRIGLIGGGALAVGAAADYLFGSSPAKGVQAKDLTPEPPKVKPEPKAEPKPPSNSTAGAQRKNMMADLLKQR